MGGREIEGGGAAGALRASEEGSEEWRAGSSKCNVRLISPPPPPPGSWQAVRLLQRRHGGLRRPAPGRAHGPVQGPPAAPLSSPLHQARLMARPRPSALGAATGPIDAVRSSSPAAYRLGCHPRRLQHALAPLELCCFARLDRALPPCLCIDRAPEGAFGPRERAIRTSSSLAISFSPPPLSLLTCRCIWTARGS